MHFAWDEKLSDDGIFKILNCNIRETTWSGISALTREKLDDLFGAIELFGFKKTTQCVMGKSEFFLRYSYGKISAIS